MGQADPVVKRVARVAEPIALAVVMQAARGLREAAARGVHHGDLSPGFLWTDADGVVRVAALGLQDAQPDRAPRAPLPFVAPERLAGGEPDARSDMYSLAACLRYLAGGPAAACGGRPAPWPGRRHPGDAHRGGRDERR